MNIRTLGNKIAVQRISAAKQTSSGIILKSTEEPDRAKVLSIGPEVDEVAIGDELLVNWNESVKVEGETYVLPITGVIWVFGT
jgi:co-chaperonin GroES (HSP10)